MAFDLGYPPHNTHNPRPGYRGTSLQEFHAAFPDNEACLRHIFETRYGQCPTCPKCRKPKKWYRISGTTRFQHPCGKAISPRGQTLFHNSQIPLQLWFYAMLHFANSHEGVNSGFLERHLGVSHTHVCAMTRKIRMHLAALDQFNKVGEEGKQVLVRLEKLLGVNVKVPGGQNRASALFVADGEQILSTVVGRARRHLLRMIIQRKVCAGAIPVTDCSWTYRALSDCGRRRPVVELLPTFMLAKPDSPDPIRSFLSHFKRPMINNYRRVDKVYLWLYLKEFEFRFNRRQRSHEVFGDMISAFPVLTSPVRQQIADWNFADLLGKVRRAS